MNKATDYFGVEIEVGDVIAYVTTASSTAKMNHGRVVAVETYSRRPYAPTPEQDFKVKIHKLGDSGYGSSPMRPVESERVITIHEIQRCINLTKYNPGNIPSA